MSFANPGDAALRALFARVKTIAVVGLSPQAARPSHRVAQAMQHYGYRIVPVRPHAERVLGEPAYASLEAIPFPVDLVNVFRAAEHLPAIVDACQALHLPALWIQEGIRDDGLAQRAVDAGMIAVMDRCILKDYIRLHTE